MPDTVGQWLDLVHALYPPGDASDWDHVGLQVGDPTWPVERVLVALDATSRVVAEAADGPRTLLVAHHPLLFRPLQKVAPTTATGRIALAAAVAKVAVVAAHTNLDTAADGAGTSDPVANVLGLKDVRPLTTEVREHDEVKLVTFVPADHTNQVLDAVSVAGAGTIGDYERCSFRVTGTGTFRPGAAADPYSGTKGQDNEESEERLEIVVPRRRLGAVVAALKASHPYDEVAYDLYPLLAGAEVGFGRVGTLPEPMPLRAVAARIRDQLPAPHLRFAGNPDRVIRTVGVVGGSGDGLIGAAIGAGVDVYVTGDLKHHVTLDALEMGLALIDAGHHATEAAALPAWIGRLAAERDRRGLGAPLVPSAVPTVPWSG